MITLENSCLKINEDGSKQWFVDGKCHRLDGPAIEHANGSKQWFVDGKCHRLDGPAIEDSDVIEWWVDGKIIPNEWIIENITDPLNIAKEEQILLRMTWS